MMAMRNAWTVLGGSITLALLAASGSLSAQGPAGWPVTGTVVDATGGVLPNAHLDLRDNSGRVVQSTVTDGTGVFRLELSELYSVQK
jgi:hypothetical protein